MPEVDHQQGHGGGDHGGDGGDAQNLGVDVLHDLAGLSPDGGSVGRAAQQWGQAGRGEPCVQPAAWARPAVGCVLGRSGMFGQANSSFFVLSKNEGQRPVVGAGLSAGT